MFCVLHSVFRGFASAAGSGVANKSTVRFVSSKSHAPSAVPASDSIPTQCVSWSSSVVDARRALRRFVRTDLINSVRLDPSLGFIHQ